MSEAWGIVLSLATAISIVFSIITMTRKRPDNYLTKDHFDTTFQAVVGKMSESTKATTDLLKAINIEITQTNRTIDMRTPLFNQMIETQKQMINSNEKSFERITDTHKEAFERIQNMWHELFEFVKENKI